MICLMFGQFAFAREDLLLGSRYTSAESAGMGGASLPLGDTGADALFSNPALFGKFKDAHFDVDESFYTNAQAITNGGLNIYKITSLSGYSSQLLTNPGSFQGVGNQLIPSFSSRYFGIGVLANNQIAAQESASGTIQYRSLYQLIPAIGGGFRLADGIIRLGYSVQWVNEAQGSVTTSSSTSPLGYDQMLQQGSGLSSTFGFAMTLPYQYLPSFNAVVRNAFSTTYAGTPVLIPSVGTSAGTLPTDPMTIDTSISVQPKLGAGTVMNLVFEYRDVTGKTGMAFAGRLALGDEIAFRDSFFLRGGFSEGYPSAGFGVRSKTGELSFTWYSEELGTSYLSDRDIHYMLQYKFRAF